MKNIFLSLVSALKDITAPPRVWGPVSSQLYHPHSQSTHRVDPAQHWHTQKLVSKQMVSQQSCAHFAWYTEEKRRGLNVCTCGCRHPDSGDRFPQHVTQWTAVLLPLNLFSYEPQKSALCKTTKSLSWSCR